MKHTKLLIEYFYFSQDFHNKKENPSQEPEPNKIDEKDGPSDSSFQAAFTPKNLTSGATKS